MVHMFTPGATYLRIGILFFVVYGAALRTPGLTFGPGIMFRVSQGELMVLLLVLAVLIQAAGEMLAGAYRLINRPGATARRGKAIVRRILTAFLALPLELALAIGVFSAFVSTTI